MPSTAVDDVRTSSTTDDGRRRSTAVVDGVSENAILKFSNAKFLRPSPRSHAFEWVLRRQWKRCLVYTLGISQRNVSASSNGRRRHCRTADCVLRLQHPSERLLEHVVASGVDDWVQTEVDEAKRAEDVEHFMRQHSVLSTRRFERPYQLKQGIALTGRNTTGPTSRAAPWWVTLRRGMLQTTTDDRQQRWQTP